MRWLTVYHATASMLLLGRALRHSPKKFSNAWTSSRTRTARILEGWSLSNYLLEYETFLQTLSIRLEPCLIDGNN